MFWNVKLTDWKRNVRPLLTQIKRFTLVILNPNLKIQIVQINARMSCLATDNQS